MRANLLSLQNISKNVSLTQNHLSTGLKINSAIDNPSSFYTARSLENRASDLNALLDSMGQAISTIQAATTTLEAGSRFLEQATAVAMEAIEKVKIPDKDFFENQEGVAAVVSTWSELDAAIKSGNKGNIVIYGKIEAQDSIRLGTGQNLVGIGYYGVEEPEVDKFSSLSFDLSKTTSTTAITVNGGNKIIADLSIKVVMPSNGGIGVLLNGEKNRIQNVDVVMDNKNMINVPNNTWAQAIRLGNGSTDFYGTNNISDINSNPSHTARLALYANGANINIHGKVNVQITD